VTKYERERRRRAKHKQQKQQRRENIIKDAERRLLGGGADALEGAMSTFFLKTARRVSDLDLTTLPKGTYSHR